MSAGGQDGAPGGAGLLIDSNLYGQLLFEFFDVAYYADFAAGAGVEHPQGVDGTVEGFAAEGAETFVDEECVDGQPTPYVAEREGKGEGDYKRFASGYCRRGASCISLIGVFYRKEERAGDGNEPVAVSELPHVVVG